MKELNYLAQKEQKIIDEAKEVLDIDCQSLVGDHIKFAPKLEQAQNKISDKMDILDDYYAVWHKIADLSFKTEKANDNVDKQVYNFITKTYGEIKKLTADFVILKNRTLEIIQSIEAGENKEED